MNARYVFISPVDHLRRHYGVETRDNFPPRYNIAPSQPIAVIRQMPTTRERAREFALVRWGFIPAWSKDGKFLDGKTLVNVRSETVAEKRSFASAYRRRRCLIPANGFYEWTGPKGDKQPWLIHQPGSEDDPLPLFSFAGIWEHWTGADGSELETAAFLTREAAADFTLHHRVPVIIPTAGYEDWLHAPETEPARWTRWVDAAQPDWQVRQVGREVSNWRNEGPELIVPKGQVNLF